MTLSEIGALVSAHYPYSPADLAAKKALRLCGDMGWHEGFSLPEKSGPMPLGLHVLIGQALREFSAWYPFSERPKRTESNPKLFAVGCLRRTLDDLATLEIGSSGNLYFGNP